MANPIFSNNKTFAGNQATMNQKLDSFQDFEQMYQAPSATTVQTGRMTYDDVIMKMGMCLGLVVVGAVVGWVVPGVGMMGAFVGMCLGLYLSFSGKASRALTLAYALSQGLFAGALSFMLESRYPGVVTQALIGTFSIFGAALYAYKSGKIRRSPKLNRMFTIAMWGLFIFGFINIIMMMTGMTGGTFGAYSAHIPGTGIPLGIGLGLLAIAMGAYSLVMDFESIDYGVKNGAPEQASWTAAFGLTLTMVWMYTEILRLLAILRENN